MKMKWLGIIDAVLLGWLFIIGNTASRVSLIFSLINFLIFFGPKLFDRIRYKMRYEKFRRQMRQPPKFWSWSRFSEPVSLGNRLFSCSLGYIILQIHGRFHQKSTAFFNSPHNFITLKFHKNLTWTAILLYCVNRNLPLVDVNAYYVQKVLAVSMQYIDFHAEGFSISKVCDIVKPKRKLWERYGVKNDLWR